MHAALAVAAAFGFSLITAADILHHVPPKILLLRTLSRLALTVAGLASFLT